ncbi:MAG: hypothetical protein ABS35_14725 [Kaistia sp. SCN 65-12]|nr:MAG: hypothetical protein ABS35_14725 [Kaistia sp. SCN 65-12]
MTSFDRFEPDAAIGLRCEDLLRRVEPGLAADVAGLLAARRTPRDGLVVPAAAAAELVERHGLADIRELMLLLVPYARTIALEAAPPCGHCRQFLAEFQNGLDLDIITLRGHRIVLRDLLPWAFSPADLGEAGVTPLVPGSIRQELAVVAWDTGVSHAIQDALVAAGRRAYVPYSRAPSAVVLASADGSLVTGAALENAAFNPSLGPLQVALVNWIAAGRAYDEIELAVLGGVETGAVDYARDLPNLLATVAPKARYQQVAWQLA